MGIGKRIKEARNALNMTQEELAKLLGVTKGAVANYENETSHPKEPVMYKMFEALQVDANYLFQDVVNIPKKNNDVTISEYEHIEKYRYLDTNGQELIDLILNREFNRTKILKEKEDQLAELNKATLPRYVVTYYQRMASAGKGMFLFDDIPTDLIEVPDTPVAHMADFVIEVIGDSMEPTYHDGDKVFVKKLDEMPNGNIGIFIKGNDCFIKELGVDRLISHNKDYPDIPASEDIRLVGKVLGRVDEFDL